MSMEGYTLNLRFKSQLLNGILVGDTVAIVSTDAEGVVQEIRKLRVAHVPTMSRRTTDLRKTE